MCQISCIMLMFREIIPTNFGIYLPFFLRFKIEKKNDNLEQES